MAVYGVLFALFVTQSADRPHSLVTQYILLPLIPWVGLLAASALATYVRLRSTPMPPWMIPASRAKASKPGLKWKVLITRIAFIPYGIILAYFVQWLNSLPPAPGEAPGRIPFNLVMLGGMGAFTASALFGLWIFVFNYMRVGSRVVWRQQRQLHDHYSAQFNEAGLVLQTPVTKIEYAWTAFAGFLETPALFVLFLSPTVFQIIPKRAFLQPPDMDVFCAAIATGIRNGRFLPRNAGFPVLQGKHDHLDFVPRAILLFATISAAADAAAGGSVCNLFWRNHLQTGKLISVPVCLLIQRARLRVGASRLQFRVRGVPQRRIRARSLSLIYDY
jgi:hypothetical protein